MCTNAVGILEMRQDIIINTLNNSFNSHSWWDEDRGDFFFRGGGGLVDGKKKFLMQRSYLCMLFESS